MSETIRRYPLRSPTWGSLFVGLAAVLAFVQLSHRPLSHTDLWGHLSYGRLLDREGTFPSAEPFVQYSTDQPLVLTSWLAQWGGYRLHSLAGATLLQTVYAAILTLATLLLWHRLRALSYSCLMAALGVLWFLWLEHQQLLVIRPQTVGIACYLLFLSLIFRAGPSTRDLLQIFILLIVLWANMHGSFPIAIVILVLMAVGRCGDVTRRLLKRGKSIGTSLHISLHNRRARTFLILACVLGLVTFLNPYGVQLWWEVLSFSKSDNLYDLVEWKPLAKTPKQGMVVLISLGMVLITLLMRRRRLRWEYWLPVIVLGVMMFCTSRYIVWWSPFLVLAFVAENRASIRKLQHRSILGTVEEFLKTRDRGSSTILATAIIIGLALSPVSRMAFSHSAVQPRSAYSAKTPIEVTEYLLKEEHPTLLFNTMEWGDWMIWKSESQLPIFVYSHVPVIQEQAWRDYMSFIRQSDGWEDRWKHYPFSHAVIDYRRHRKLVNALRKNPEWREVYRDQIAIVLKRTGISGVDK